MIQGCDLASYDIEHGLCTGHRARMVREAVRVLGFTTLAACTRHPVLFVSSVHQ